MGILSIISGGISMVNTLLGMKRDAGLKQSGIDAQKLGDANAEVATLKAEQVASAQPSETSANLNKGDF